MTRGKRNWLFLLLGGALFSAAGFWAYRPLASQLESVLEQRQEKIRERADFERLGASRDAAEQEVERKWLATPATACEDFGRGSSPQLCIEYLGRAEVPIGTPVTYRVRWRNLPADAYIRVWSRNTAEAGRWRYMGAQGAIAPEALGGAAEGEVRAVWDGRSVYCAPADRPMMCDVGEVGRYRLRAAILTGSDPFWPSWPPPRPAPVVHHARSETEAFALLGDPEPVSRAGGYHHHPQYAAIVAAIQEALPRGAVGTDRYVERHVDRLGPWRLSGSRYCARLELDSPLSGTVDVCFPSRLRDENGIRLSPGDITASSNARLQDDLISAEAATAKASAYAIALTNDRATFPAFPTEEEMVGKLHPNRATYDGSYQGLRDSARDAGLTYVEVNQPTPSFQEGPGGSWWLLELSLWIRTVDGPQVADWGRLSLRVDHDGFVCQVDEIRAQGASGQQRRFSPCRPGSRRRH